MTSLYGMVVFTGCDGELVDPEVLRSFYADFPLNGDYVRGRWRPARFDELIATWPARSGSKGKAEGALWRQPTIEELRAGRKGARSMERRQKSASLARVRSTG